jgi:hypothetical protein
MQKRAYARRSLIPFIFNLAVDTLSQILNKAKIEGYLQGLGKFNNKNIINLKFVNDTLIFLKAYSKRIEALKLLLVGFENLSGLKINYTKSELIPLNLTDEESTCLAQIFGYKVDKLLINYFGVPLH